MSFLALSPVRRAASPFTVLLAFLVAACDLADPHAESALGQLAGEPVETYSVTADDLTCTGHVGPISVDGNVIVPDDAQCRLNGTRVDGNIHINTGATLLALGVDVGGNIQAEGHDNVVVRDRDGRRSVVGGSIQINQGDRAAVARTRVNGDVQVEQNDGQIFIAENRINANLQVNQNTGGVQIVRNVVAQAMQCQANNPAPVGGGNVAGDKEDQCAAL